MVTLESNLQYTKTRQNDQGYPVLHNMDEIWYTIAIQKGGVSLN